MSKFKEGDRVKVLENRLSPKSVGRVGEVVKVLQDSDTGEPLYKVRLDGNKTVSRGVAEEYCLDFA